uniref:SpoIIE family protein phosphatase n=1 Tax=Agathobacter sp. TaxID=2021311 RepID=UPI004055E09E
MHKKRSVLAMKIMVSFILLAVLICVVGTGIRFFQYRSYIQKQYNNTAYQIAAVFRDYLSEEQLEKYIQMAKQYKEGRISIEVLEQERSTSEYRQIEAQLKLLRENMGANDIYLAYLDVQELYEYDGTQENWHPMTYVFDCYREPDMVFQFGDMGGLNPEFIEDAIEVAETGKRSDNYFISKSNYGYNTSAILPIVKDGKTIAVVGVEISMSTLQRTLLEYVGHSAVGMVVMSIFWLAIYGNYLYRYIVAPINLIAEEANRFTGEKSRISKKLSEIHTKDEIQTLSETLLKMEVDITQYIDNLTYVTAEKERIGAELNVATQIQADMLPRIFPAFPERSEFDIFASMNPAKEVGGDFYDFFLVDENHLAMVVADVSGKGIPAALFMVITKTLIKNEAQMGKSTKEVIEAVNNQLCQNNEAEMFVTAWMGILEISSGKITAVNAGHEYPIVKHAGGNFEVLEDPHGFVMAIMPDMEHEAYEIRMQKGDSIFVCSDGALDAINKDEQQFGQKRLLDTLNSLPNGTTKEILHEVQAGIADFVGETEQFDDITLLCMTYHG